MSKFSIHLRAFKDGDHVLINRWRSDYELQKCTTGQFKFVSPIMEWEWVKSKMLNNRDNLYLAICKNDERETMVGYLSLCNIDYLNQHSEVGIMIGDPSCRNGVTAIQAYILLFTYAFDHLNMNRIGSYCLPDHYFSPFLMQSLGFVKEGTRRQVIFKNGKFHDLDDYGLLRADWNMMKEKGDLDIKKVIRRCITLTKSSKTC